MIWLDFSTKNHILQSTSGAHLWQSRKPREEAAHLVGHARHHVLTSGGQDQADLQVFVHLSEPSVVVVEVVEQLVRAARALDVQLGATARAGFVCVAYVLVSLRTLDYIFSRTMTDL